MSLCKLHNFLEPCPDCPPPFSNQQDRRNAILQAIVNVKVNPDSETCIEILWDLHEQLSGWELSPLCDQEDAEIAIKEGVLYGPNPAIRERDYGVLKNKTTIQIVHDLLQRAMDEVGDRATTYDTPQGEESMPKVVEMFNVLYGKELTVEQGWMFMVLLKTVRSSQGQRKLDNYVDLAAYAAFAGKASTDLPAKTTSVD